MCLIVEVQSADYSTAAVYRQTGRIQRGPNRRRPSPKRSKHCS